MSREINELIADSRVAPLVKLYDARGDEIDRLRALNAELIAALLNLVNRYPNNVGMVQARAALAKAGA